MSNELAGRAQDELGSSEATPSREDEIDQAFEYLRPGENPSLSPASGYSPEACDVERAEGDKSGLGLLVAAAALFGVCSLVQHAYGSSMFEFSYSDPGFVGAFLVNVTFKPGWVFTVALAGRGLLRIARSHAAK